VELNGHSHCDGILGCSLSLSQLVTVILCYLKHMTTVGMKLMIIVDNFYDRRVYLLIALIACDLGNGQTSRSPGLHSSSGSSPEQVEVKFESERAGDGDGKVSSTQVIGLLWFRLILVVAVSRLIFIHCTEADRIGDQTVYGQTKKLKHRALVQLNTFNVPQ